MDRIKYHLAHLTFSTIVVSLLTWAAIYRLDH